MLAAAALLPACDDAEPLAEDVSFRSAEDQDDGGDPEPSSLGDDIFGGVDIRCPECGSHWTSEGEIVAVYLSEKFGSSILALTGTGTLRYQGTRAHFSKDNVRRTGKGFTIEFPARLVATSEVAEPGCLDAPVAELSFAYEAVPVRAELRYVNNTSGDFDDPPCLE